MRSLYSDLLPSFTKNKLYSYFQHPQSVCMTYFQHCAFSLKLARCFAIGSCKAVIHAFFPSLYITSSTDLLITMKEDMNQIVCHKNKDIDEKIPDEKKSTSAEQCVESDENELTNWTNHGTFIIEENDT